jgi:hypothetical protein
MTRVRRDIAQSLARRATQALGEAGYAPGGPTSPRPRGNPSTAVPRVPFPVQHPPSGVSVTVDHDDERRYEPALNF